MYKVPGELFCHTTGQPVAFGAFSDIYKGSLNERDVCIKLLREPKKGNKAAAGQVVHPHTFPHVAKPRKSLEALCEEAVIWKRLNDLNITPFRGVTFNPFPPNGIGMDA